MQIPDEAKWHDWFFRTHNPAELKEWTSRMRFFRFHRAIGGHANDGDTLRCALRVESEADLAELTGKLGIALQELPSNEPQPVLGQRYSASEMRKFRYRMEPFPRFQQLGWITLASVECWAHVSGSRLELELSGRPPIRTRLRKTTSPTPSGSKNGTWPCSMRTSSSAAL